MKLCIKTISIIEECFDLGLKVFEFEKKNVKTKTKRLKTKELGSNPHP
jgi:hypothetical protein